MKSLKGAKRLVSRNMKNKGLISIPAIMGMMAMTLAMTIASSASAAAAGEPWWELSSGSRPAYLQLGGEGTIVVQAINVGDAPTSGPIMLNDMLPAGLKVQEEEIRSVPNSEMQRDRRGSAGRAWKDSMVRGMSKSRVGQLHMPRFGIV